MVNTNHFVEINNARNLPRGDEVGQRTPKRFCADCGEKIEGTIWTDTPFFTLTHGGGFCKECYAKKHATCACGEFLNGKWRFCPWCGRETSGSST